MIRGDRIVILATIVAVVALLAWGATIGAYPVEANVFPAIAALGVVVFGLMAMCERDPGGEPHAVSPGAVAWLAAALPLIALLGFRVGLPLYALAYALARRTRPLAALALAIGIAAVVEILFVRVLRLPLGWGWLAETLS